MKIILAAVGLFTALTVAACGGSSGHSDSYNKGYKWASDNSGLASAQAGLMGASTICGAWANNQAQGLNQQEWIKGCEDALAKEQTSVQPT